jgi:hypothetical protein
MKTLALVAVVVSLAFAANVMADNTSVQNSKVPAAKVQTTTTTPAPTAKMDMSKGCNMPMDHAKSGGCCGM